MGAYLDTPVKDKNPVSGSNDKFSWGACEMQGWRTSMEDAHIAKEVALPDGRSAMVFGVFDGHGGKDVAKYAEENYVRVLIDLPEFKAKNYEKALEVSFLKLDEEVSHQEYAVDEGSTACVVMITPDKIYCSNAGDSRGVLNNNGKACPLSEDHKPDNTIEY